MKKLIIILILSGITLISTGCGKGIISITYQDLEKKIEQKETFILEIMQDGCSHCEEFTPRLEKIVKKYNLDDVYQINLSKLSEKEFNQIQEKLSVSSTPVVTFYKNGKEQSSMYRIEGAVSNATVISKLKDLGYIKNQT